MCLFHITYSRAETDIGRGWLLKQLCESQSFYNDKAINTICHLSSTGINPSESTNSKSVFVYTYKKELQVAVFCESC